MATQLKDSASVEAILSEMTLEEKAQMIQGGTPFRSAAMPKYGIPALYMIDTTTGLNLREYIGEALYGKLAAEAEAAGKPLDREKNGYMGGLLIALDALKKMMVERAKSGAQAQRQENGCYPPSIALACTWNPELVEEDGRIVASELGSKGIDMILGPCMNIHRDPLCGRLAESYSEDPYLTGVMAAAMTKGIQSTGVLANLKHFAANSQEKDRMGVEEHIPERALREIYFPAFKRCVDAGAKTIMSAYNKVNGVPCAMNKWLLTDVLRKEWGFEGFVVSDWGASYDVPTAVAAGTDLTMPGPLSVKKITEAVAQGRLKEEDLDAAIRNILRVTLSSIPMTGARPSFDLKDAYAVTEKAAQEGTVLLKNDGALPIPTDAKVAFYGKRRKKFVAIPASVAASTDLVTNPQDSVCALIGEENVLIGESVRNAAYRIVTVGADAAEGLDRMDMEMDADDRDALEQALSDAQAFGGKLILIVNSVGPVELSEYTERVNAIVCPFFGGMMSGKVTADILFGKVKGDRMRSLIDYINTHYAEKMLLTELAEKEELSLHYLSHLFQESLGMPFQEYLSRVRCEQARRLLLSTDQTLLDIGIACGFSDPKYFNRGFRRQYGCSPKEYRKRTSTERQQKEKDYSFSEQDFLSPEESLELLTRIQ